MKKIVKYISMFVIAISLVGCSSTSEDSNLSINKDELVVGLDDTFAPMGFKNEDGELVGFDIDLANEVAKRIDKKITFQPIDWSLKETELNAGNIDLIWNGYSITDERKEKVLYSDPYIDNSQLIVVLKDSDIKTKKDLANKNVATQRDSSTIDAFKNDDSNIVKKFNGGEPLLYATFTDVFMELDNKRADAIVGDAVLVKYIIKQKANDSYRILEDNFGSEQMGIGMRKEDTKLKEAIDNALNDMKDDGTYDKIFSKWFSE